MKMKPITLSLLITSAMLMSGCETIWNADGNFEEAENSGRLMPEWDVPDNTRRYFRLHLKQFDDTLGGTFETFDLLSFESFTQTPQYMDRSMMRYYCARIDYGYVRDNNAYISFTDREQRHWNIALDLKTTKPYGRLYRTDSNRVEIFNDNDNTLMPEDVAYLKSDFDPNYQIVFKSMPQLDSRALECVYYFKNTNIDFILPSSLNLKTCTPSPKQCRSLRLAIIGTPVQPWSKFNDAPPTKEILTAQLDSYDIDENQLRTIALRENPHIFRPNTSGMFIATAIIYQDADLNGKWDKTNEPIYAALNNQSIVFYEEQPNETIYSSSIDGEQSPILQTEENDEKNNINVGWHVYNDISYPLQPQNTNTRILKKLTPTQTPYLSLNAINLEPQDPNIEPGCYVQPTSPQQIRCTQWLPILLQ